jgi:hypothetical protein
MLRNDVVALGAVAFLSSWVLIPTIVSWKIHLFSLLRDLMFVPFGSVHGPTFRRHSIAWFGVPISHMNDT